jgi:hypothetical protein
MQWINLSAIGSGRAEKCRLCSKLSSQEAQARHGKIGDGCWDDAKCHNRRSYYRHRGIRNHTRKQQRRSETQTEMKEGDPCGICVAARATSVTIEISVPAIPAAVMHWYRETKDSPLHALSAELWMGNDRVAKIEPVHCLGLTELQVKTLLLRILDCFSQHTGLDLLGNKTGLGTEFPASCSTYATSRYKFHNPTAINIS